MTRSLRPSIIALALALLCGCRSPDPVDGYHRTNDSRFSQRQREVIMAAQRYLEQQYHKPIDGWYRVRETPEGYAVTAWFASSYDHGRPQFGPGDSAIVMFARDLTVTQFYPGY